MYAETIDKGRDSRDTTLLSDTANTLAQVAEAKKAAISRILNGPAETQMTDFFIQKAASNEVAKTRENDKNNSIDK